MNLLRFRVVTRGGGRLKGRNGGGRLIEKVAGAEGRTGRTGGDRSNYALIKSQRAEGANKTNGNSSGAMRAQKMALGG